MCGQINGTHISTLPTASGSKLDYLSKTQKYAINEQVAFASYLLFLDAVAGIPRSFHDAKNLTMGHITSKMQINRAFYMPSRGYEGFKVRSLLLRN